MTDNSMTDNSMTDNFESVDKKTTANKQSEENELDDNESISKQLNSSATSSQDSPNLKHLKDLSTESEQIIKDAMLNCIDPLTGCNLVSLGIIESVDIHMGMAKVAIILPCQPEIYSNTSQLEEAVVGQLKSTGIVNKVTFSYSTMTESEKDAYVLHLETTYQSKNQLKDSTRIIAVSSGKGGVGKSSVSVNLAIGLSQLKYRVGLLDADVYGFSVPNMLGPNSEPVIIGNSVIPARSYNVNFVSAGLFANDDQPIIWRGPMLHKALEQFLSNVMWCEPDFLVVDMPPGTGDVALSIASLIPDAEFYVVTTPQKSAESVAQRSALAAKQLKLPVRGIIENMSYFKGDDNKIYELFGSGGGKQLADNLNVKLLGQIPLEVDLRSGSDSGTPILISHPESSASMAIKQIVESIVKLGPAKKRLGALKIK